jgi:hypothetical protein
MLFLRTQGIAQTPCSGVATMVEQPSVLRGCDLTFPVSFEIFHDYQVGSLFKVTITYRSALAISGFGATVQLEPNFFQTTGTVTVDNFQTVQILFDRLDTWGIKPEGIHIVIEDLSCAGSIIGDFDFVISMDKQYVDLRGTTLNNISEIYDAGYFKNAFGNIVTTISVIVDDQLILDENFAIETVPGIFNELIFMPGASVNATTGRFTLTGIKVHTCSNTMAEGIIANTAPENGIVTIQGSDIMDCHFGINAAPGANIHISNSNFLNNYIGINLDMSNASSGQNHLQTATSLISGSTIQNIFFGQDLDDNTLLPNPIKSAYAGMGVGVGEVGYAGIVLKNYDDFKLFGSSNTFDKMANGIVADRSNFHLFEASFSNLNSTFSGYQRKGYGIFADGKDNSHWMHIGLPSKTMKFGNVPIGVYAERMAGSVEKTDMTGMNSGIIWRNSKLRDVFIKDNKIVARTRGIYSANNEPLVLRSSIDRNVITITGSNSTGIDAFEVLGAPSGGWKMNTNTITLNGSSSNGIRYRNGIEGAIVGSTITGSGKENVGIHLEHTNNVDVIGNPKIEVGSKGIYALGNTADYIQCNTTKGSEKGLQITDINDNIVVEGNTMSKNGRGLEYGSDAMPDAPGNQQYHTGNIWEGDATDFGAFHHNPTDAYNSPYNVDPFGNPAFLPSTINTNNWFFPEETTPLTLICPPLNLNIKPNTGKPDKFDEATATGEYHPVRFGENLEWKAAYRLYRKLISDPSFEESNSTFHEFRIKHENSPLGQLAWIAEQSKTIFQLNENQRTNLEVAITD